MLDRALSDTASAVGNITQVKPELRAAPANISFVLRHLIASVRNKA